MVDTIVAISTPRGAAARGVIRVSGPDSRELVGALCEGGENPQDHGRGVVDSRLLLGRSRTSVPVRLIVTVGPRSFTGEDVVEVHIHGSPMLLEVVQGLLVLEGGRLAGPGEFTRRAYLNGRLDLTRAEAVLALIRAGDDREREAALALLEGGVERRVAVVRDRVLHALVPLELGLDFSDQDVEVPLPAGVVDGLQRSVRDLDALAEGAREQGAARSCFRVVLEGPANAGKSSLFNRLVGRDAALVTPIPGTTRDALCAEIEVDGCRFELVDTAGNDVTRTEADAAAHKQRRRRLREADLVIEVHDLRRPPTRTRPDHLLVLTHLDLWEREDPGAEDEVAACAVSNVTGTGFSALRSAIIARLERGCAAASHGVVHVTTRQAHAFRVASERIGCAMDALSRGSDAELVASDLHAALAQLREVIGEKVGDDVLDRVFRDFCIGK